MKIGTEKRERILEAVTLAGRGLLSAHDIESHMKVKPGDANFATVWDVETQRTLCGELQKIIPEARFIAEEGDENNDETVGDGDVVFIVDPIDGTTNFIHGLSHSAVCVAVAVGGSPVFGCVYNPFLDEIFYAHRGDGAFLRKRGATVRLHVSERKLPDALAAFGTTPYERGYADATFARAKALFLACREVRREGSAALDICYVAAGRYDVYFEMKLSPWDFAAAEVIINEAGGMLTRLDGGKIDARRPTSVLATNIAAREDAIRVLDGACEDIHG